MEGEKGTTTPQGTKISVSVEQRDMVAMCNIRGPYDSVVRVDYIMRLLVEFRIQHGINKQAIQKLIDEYNSRKARKNINLSSAVAQGKPVKKGQDAKITILIEEASKVTIKEEDKGKADFRNINKFKTITKGQKLAAYEPPIKGVDGINVYGQLVQPPEVNDAELDHGENVSFEASINHYIALVDGVFERKPNYIDVNPVLEIPENVGLETGNLDYEGDIVISNNIERSASVKSLSNVEVGGTVESGNINIGDSLIVTNGINTNMEGNINVKGVISAGYIENSVVTAMNGISVKKSIVGSKIISYQNIVLSEKNSSIVGGENYAYKSIQAANIGNRNEIKTVLHLGYHYQNAIGYEELLKEGIDIEKKFKALVQEVVRLKAYIEQMKGKLSKPQVENIRKKFDQYKVANFNRERYQNKLAQLKRQRYNPKEVMLTVRDTIYPGVEIFYMGTLEKIKTKNTMVIFKFKPDADKAIIVPYVPKDTAKEE
jgi:hypothetical protein